MRKNLHAQVHALEIQQTPFFLEIQRSENKIKQTTLKLEQFMAKTKDLRQKAAMLNRAKKWVGNHGVRTFIMDNTLRQLEASMVKYASQLFPEDEITIRLDTTDDGRIERIIKVSHVNTTLSGGQFRRMEIASFLSYREAAICRSGRPCNVIWLDEPTHSLDLAGVGNLTETLRTFCNGSNDRTVMFITHENTYDQSAYDGTVHVVRKGKVSHLRNTKKRKCNH